MHVHANQINPSTQLDALYAAERAAAKREAEGTRRKLMEFASELAGEAECGEACVVRLGGDEERRRKAKEQGEQDEDEHSRGKRTEVDANSGHESRGHVISDWT
jgi:hypothetical protein